MTTTPSVDEPVVEIDLTNLDELLDVRHARRFDEAHIVEWLRTSGGSLTDRVMKSAAADLIERREPAAD
jgi:hypothetical protein